VVFLFPYKDNKLTRAEFDTAWNRLPEEWAVSLLNACYEVNAQWGTPAPKAEKTEENSTPAQAP
jgi:hypothetical protein